VADNRISIHGKVPAFSGDDFELFAEQLEFYFIANGVGEEITKKAILLYSLSLDNYRLLCDLVVPNKPKDNILTFHSIVQKMKEHTKPEKSPQLARYEFDNLMKNSGERMADFVARLKHISVACKFPSEERPARLKDRFIAGLQDQKMVSAILRINLEDITLRSSMRSKLHRLSNSPSKMYEPSPVRPWEVTWE